MGTLVVTTNISLDGVTQDPTGEEGFSPGGWFYEFGGKDLEQWAKALTEEALGAEALLLGRKSDEWFATRWLGRTGEWADRLNNLPKYVVSSTLKEARWSNSTVLNGNLAKEVANLKDQVDGEILIYASAQLVRTLTELDLVDEFRLVVFPVVLGTGDRLFAESSVKRPLRLVSTETIGEGLAFVTYEVVRGSVHATP
jgi:dihydrofolate reductase